MFVEREMMKMMMFLSLLILILISPLSSSSTIQFPSNSEFPSTQAEKLIRELNLFPKSSINIIDHDDAPPIGPRIVEKRFKFPNLADNSVSVEDLGHHAGYYQIQHSYAARYFLNPGFSCSLLDSPSFWWNYLVCSIYVHFGVKLNICDLACHNNPNSA